MKKGLKRIAVILAAFFLTGCQNDIEPAPDITSLIESSAKSDISEAIETTDISIGEDVVTSSGEEEFIPKLLMDTDKPFVLAEDKYIIEKSDIDVSAFNEYGYTEYVDDGRYYYSSTVAFLYGGINPSLPTQAGDEATIFAYDSKSGECQTLYSEAPKADGNKIIIEISGIWDSYLYFDRTETGLSENQMVNVISNDFLRLDLRNNSTEKIFSFGNEGAVAAYSPVVSGDMLFLTVLYISNESKFMIYQYDMNTGEFSLFRDDAEFPVPYNNGIIYFHDGGYYYHGEAADIRGQGIFYQGDELIFYSYSKEISEKYTANIGTDALIYTHINTDDGNFNIAGSTMGIFDRDFNRIDIASTKKDTWSIKACGISKTGLVAIDAPKPMIYDTNEECFAVISIDDYKYYYSFTAEDSVCFLGYDRDDDLKYISAALYTVKRR